MAAVGITVLKRNAPWGPFTREQIAEGLERGDFTLGYLACAPGLKEWLPLGEVLDYAERHADAPELALPKAPFAPLLPPIPQYGGVHEPAPPEAGESSRRPPELPARDRPPDARPPQFPPRLTGNPDAMEPPAPAMVSKARLEPLPEMVQGGFFLRFIAFLIDCGILFIPVAFVFVAGIISVHAPGLFHRTTHEAQSEQWAPIWINIKRLAGILAIGCGWFYAAGLESSGRQATIGKRWMGLKVTDARGERLSFARATGRYAAKYLSALPCFLGFMAALFSARGLALHDRLAGTRVVRNES